MAWTAGDLFLILIISELLENVISSRLNIQSNYNHLFNVVQSDYRQFHLTETDPLKVLNDI